MYMYICKYVHAYQGRWRVLSCVCVSVCSWVWVCICVWLCWHFLSTHQFTWHMHLQLYLCLHHIALKHLFSCVSVFIYYTCIYIYIYVICTYLHTCRRMYIYIYIYTYIHTYQGRWRVLSRVCVCACVSVCVCVCVCVRAHTHTHTHTHTHISLCGSFLSVFCPVFKHKKWKGDTASRSFFFVFFSSLVFCCELQNVFSYYRMCSLTTGCENPAIERVLLLLDALICLL